jgi:predicted nucleic acid-binding protein
LPTKPEAVLLDTSAALALVTPGNDLHERAQARLRGHRLGLAGHATFETYSVLTRLPGHKRLTAAGARRLIETNFPASVHLDAGDSATMLARLTAAGVSGGAIYDGLVAAAAKAAGLLLVSSDRRAVETYLALGVQFELLG